MKNQTLFRTRFVFLWLAQIFSQLAFNMLNFILIVSVFEQTNSNTAVSGLIISFTIPALLFGLLAGAYVDRRNKKSVLLLTNIFRAASSLGFYFLKDSLGIVYLLSFFTSIATQFFVPAEASTIPRIVARANVLRANSLFTITLYGSIIAGYIMAGPAIKFLGFQSSFLLGALFYFIASFFTSLLPSIGAEKDVQVEDFLGNGTVTRAMLRIREAYDLIKGLKNIVITIFFLTLSQGLIVILATLLPGYAKTVLKIQGSDISFVVLIPASIGMVLGSFVLAKMGKKISRTTLVNFGVVLSGLILVVLPYFSEVVRQGNLRIYLVAAHMFILGIANAFIVVISNATLQSDIEKKLVGRVYGVVIASSAGFSLFPVALAGILADIFSTKAVLMSTGILMLTLGVIKTYRDYVK